MIDRIMGGEKHVVGKAENVLRHSWGCRDGRETSREIATWRVAEESTSNWSALIRQWIESMDFHSRNPRHPLGIWLSDFRSIALVILIPMTYVFLLNLIFLSFNLCHPTHIRSYLNSIPICPTHFHSFAYSSLSYLWCAYLILVAIAIRLDYLAP